MNYSSLGKRFVGSLIDSVAVNILTGVFVVVFGFIGVAISWIVYVGYNVLMMGGPWHATLGQKVFNISVVDEHGVGIDYAKALIRSLCSWLSSILLGIGYIVALFSNEKQTLHDRIAGTYVVDDIPAAIASTPAPAPAPVQNRSAANAYVVGVSGEKAGMRFPITGNGIMIGRDPAVCQIVMGNSTGVSRLHCLVSYNVESGMFIVSDRNSTYGTFTQSGVRVSPTNSVALRRGERFYLGSKQNMFEVC